MPRLARLLPALACALSACVLAPTAAFGSAPHRASGQSGVVLATTHHGVRLVDRGHRVSDVRLGSTRGLHRGDVVAVRKGHAKVTGSVHRIAFLGRVVRTSARGTVLRLGDGSTFKLGKKAGRRGHGARLASTLTVDIQGLTPGQTILVTVSTDGQGNVVLTIKIVSGATNIGDGEQHAQGTITDDSGDGAFAIRTSDGNALRFSDPDGLFESEAVEWCDTVDVSYRVAARKLVVDELSVTGQSDEGACADDGGFDEGDEYDGIVTAIAGDLSSLTVDPGDGDAAATIPVEDSTVLDGVSIGDDVSVITDEGGFAIEIDVFDSGEGDPGDDSGDEGDA